MDADIIDRLDNESIYHMIAMLIEDNRTRTKVLRNISYYYGGRKVYIEKYENEERNKKIKELYDKYSLENKQKNEIINEIYADLETMKANGDLSNFIHLTKRVIRHVVDKLEWEKKIGSNS